MFKIHFSKSLPDIISNHLHNWYFCYFGFSKPSNHTSWDMNHSNKRIKQNSKTKEVYTRIVNKHKTWMEYLQYEKQPCIFSAFILELLFFISFCASTEYTYWRITSVLRLIGLWFKDHWDLLYVVSTQHLHSHLSITINNT